ncbi:hypothetical protein evm_012602 [Chilo suppressalis]|nr:hypothetical protein evm_012602 [Chilo suppressalis]
MFQKPTFGSTSTSTFGSFNAGTSASSPFGGFKPTTGTSAFGAPPAFGAAASTQPATGGGLFGASNNTGGLFGNTAASTSTPAFGSTTGGFGFGSSAPSTGFGTNVSTGLFGNAQNTSAFGAKPAGFGFGSTPTAGTTTGGLFGATPTAGTGLFGQQNTSMTGGGLFSNTTGGGAFGQSTATGTGHVKYSPVVGTDVVVKGGNSQNINIKHHCITCMKEYENKSLEELRLEDYTAGRKGAQGGGMFGSGFGTQQTETKPLFGGSTFGQPATTTVASMFGGSSLGTTPGFGQTSTFSFGGNTQNTANTSLFGANKPAFGTTATTGTGLFGTTTTQAPSFGANTSTFGFGAPAQNQSGGLFGAKPATTGFGTAPASTSFGSFTGGGLFQNKPQQAAPAFGTAQPAFGNLSGGFGTATSTSGGLFGANSTFGKPVAQAPAFGFSQPSLGTGLGTGLGNNQNKMMGGFNNMSGGGLFQQPQQNSVFRTDSGLGGTGMFGGNTSLGAPSLGLGLNANNTSLNNSGLSGASAAGNVHEQMLTLAARPYGDSPLFKDLVPGDPGTTADEVLKPTNPAAVKAILDSGRLPPTRPPLRLQPRPLPNDKKSLFDGLEESDTSLEDKLSLKPSRKRLVLRPNPRGDSQQDNEQTQQTDRIVEDQRNDSIPNQGTESEPPADVPDSSGAGKRSGSFAENNNDISADKNNSWLSSSKLPWNDKEKPLDNEPTPRLYPRLDKEIQSQTSERRASWLTTKPLRKPLITNPDSAENSVRELGVRSPDRMADKENIDSLSVSEEENVSRRDMPPHPAGVKLTRPGYFTLPSLQEMIGYMRPDGSCVVPHLTIGRHNYGNVFFDTEIDVAGLDLDALVHFLNKEVIIYPDDVDKPPVGSELNRRAIVTLDRVWPRDKTQRRPITDPDRLLKMEYEARLRRVCDKHDTKFIEYRPQTGSWVFRVEHFSKYGLTDSDEEDDAPTPDVMKRQLVNQALQKAAPVAPPKPPPSAPTPGLGGLGLPSTLAEDSLFAMHQTSLNLLNGSSKAFDMDTTEDNAEAQSLYQDNRAYGVKSPTTELARLENRQSHHVQLMKASLYADTEMEDDASVSTGDQLVPISAPLLSSVTRAPSIATIEPENMDESIPAITEECEQPMRPLIVQPHTIVLKYHRKVPPFKETIAGRLDASYLADMSICRARHFRVGFGPGGVMAFLTSRDTLVHLPNNAQLCDLNKYVRGRGPDDWSDYVVSRMAIGQGDSGNYLQEALSRHLETLLDFSDLTVESEDTCPYLTVRDKPADRRKLLNGHLRDASALQSTRDLWGVSSAYCLQVWKLCDALWGDDLDNGGLPGTDAASIVGRHRKFLYWMSEVVSDITDKELATPAKGEAEDEDDGHSSRIWTLLLGGRLPAACRLARQHNDLNMAALLAQASGDPTFRSLVSRQLSQWRECGADSLISSHRLESLRLVAGEAKPLGKLTEVDWLRALHATARYLCPQIPSIERVVSTYEGFFGASSDDEEMVDILKVDEMGMQPPLPPYMEQYQLDENGKQHRVFDLRYELIRARANNTRPKLQPASYTPDPLDYSLCFLLGTWFGNPTVESITGVASQLEACGLWHLAIQALYYHPDANQ